MPQTYHFIGIGGIGMSGLARILLSKNIPVSGSDISLNYAVEGLINAGATIHKGHSADVISSQMTVVYGSDIKPDNPEYLAAIQKQCALLHRSDLLAQLVHESRSLAVAGTHGKTTTSALLATVLVEAGVDPSFAVGGMLPQFHANSRFGQGEYFAFEADESDRTFLKYHPFGAIVTNIDNDHLNNYEGNEDLLVQCFKTFMSQVTSPQHLFWCAEDAHLKRLNMPGNQYGFGDECDWQAYNIRQKGFNMIFDIKNHGKIYQDIEIARAGEFNVLNALAVFGLALTLGLDEMAIRRAFRTFQGVMRRCEKKGEINGVLFIDDYAHHPTEIRVTLQAIRKAIKEKRLIAVFQPHRYSRTKDCLGMYGHIFEAADEVIVTDLFGAGEAPIPDVSHVQILEEIQAHSAVNCQYVPRSALSHMLAQFVQPHDVVVTLGAGDITKACPETIAALEKLVPRCLKLGLIFGGSTTEHEISIRSSNHFRESLKSSYYDVENIGITKKGTWIIGQEAKLKLETILTANGEDPGTGFSTEVLQKLKECDVLIPALHGPYGEDGMIQGLFETLDRAYVGCDHRSSAVCMDKIFCKKLAIYHGIKTSPFVDFSLHEWQTQKNKILKEIHSKLTFPVFVKPSHLGSAVGVKKVIDKKILEKVIEHVLCFDSHVLVENGIVCREIEFAALGNEEIQVFPPGEILNGGAMYDYESKYSENSSPTTPSANLSQELIEEGCQLAGAVYRMIGCQGLARVDFFLDQNNTYWFNEINPLPGFTSISLYPQMCAVNGLGAKDLMDQLIILALHHKRKQKRIERSCKKKITG